MSATTALVFLFTLASADESPVPVEIIPLDAAPVNVTDFKLDKDWKVTARKAGGKKEAVSFRGDELLSVRISATQPPARPKGMQAILAGGDVLACKAIVGTEGENLMVRGGIFGDAALPLSSIRGLLLDPETTESSAADLVRWISRKRTADAVLYRNQDELKGSFVDLTDKRVRVEVNKKPKDIERPLAVAVAFDPSLVEAKPIAGTHAWLRLADGSSLAIAALEAPGLGTRPWQATAAFGAKLAIDPDDLVDLSLRHARVTYLSDQTPTATTVQPYLDDRMAPRFDRNVLGDPIRLAGRVYAKGIGVRSHATLTYKAAGYQRFEATIGLDDAAGQGGSVRFMVLLDGKKAFDSGDVDGGAKPQKLRLPLGNAKEISLVVDYAKRGDVQDFADWADARLLR